MYVNRCAADSDTTYFTIWQSSSPRSLCEDYPANSIESLRRKLHTSRSFKEMLFRNRQEKESSPTFKSTPLNHLGRSRFRPQSPLTVACNRSALGYPHCSSTLLVCVTIVWHV
ncbi:hypothetical protein TNCV_495621 [Trichonephila clavipes]|nr:hypothetical protein TNCV_495621 [Trichonephila clavipes]